MAEQYQSEVRFLYWTCPAELKGCLQVEQIVMVSCAFIFPWPVCVKKKFTQIYFLLILVCHLYVSHRERYAGKLGERND